MVPFDSRTRQWVTVDADHSVLLVSHNITTLSRMLDIIPAFDNDPRIQLFITATAGDPFRHGLDAEIQETGIISLDWQDAQRIPFDLAIAASHHDGVEEMNSPLVVLSHGIGYTKYSDQEPGTFSDCLRNGCYGTGNRLPARSFSPTRRS